jgi:hypothetical protein
MTKTVIRLSRDFYRREVIEEALIDFKEFCNGKILNNEFDIELATGQKIEVLGPEFCNYVLGLMKNKSLI